MPATLRILDANANRAREALRVMEEAARFLLDHEPLSRELKALRHDLAEALASVAGLEANRDTPGDVGLTNKTASEGRRDSVHAVVTAAGKRLSEALRAVEEYGKTLGQAIAPADFAASIERLRYRGYDLEHRLGLALGTGRARQWRLCLLLTESLCTHQSWGHVLQSAIAAGVDCVQVREKQLDARPLLQRVREVIDLCRPRGVSVIVNDRPDVAMLAGADGVHLGQTDLVAAEVRRLFGTQLIVGVSTSSLDQARTARDQGADYCGVGPMFHTTTKHKDVIVGPDYLGAYLAWNGLPHLAIGGIGPDNLDALVAAGVRGIAVSSAICSAPDPATATRQLRTRLDA